MIHTSSMHNIADLRAHLLRAAVSLDEGHVDVDRHEQHGQLLGLHYGLLRGPTTGVTVDVEALCADRVRRHPLAGAAPGRKAAPFRT